MESTHDLSRLAGVLSSSRSSASFLLIRDGTRMLTCRHVSALVFLSPYVTLPSPSMGSPVHGAGHETPIQMAV